MNNTKANLPIIQSEELVSNGLAKFKKLKFEDLTIHILSDGILPRSPIHPDFAPETNLEALEQILLVHGRSIESIDLDVNIVLIEAGDRKILLDVGCGENKENEQVGWLNKSLGLIGLKPEQITDIVISHIHPDHIEGLLGITKTANFPHARIHLSELEARFWRNAQIEDFKESGLYKINPNAIEDIIQRMKLVLEEFKSQIDYIDFEKGLFGILSFKSAPGHTKGMFVTSITSVEKRISFIADLVHHDLIQFIHPYWSFSGDQLPELAANTRVKFFHEFAKNQELIIGTHLTWPGIGTIQQGDDVDSFLFTPYVFVD